MLKPPQKPRFVRTLLYYLHSLQFTKIVRNWYLIPLGYLGLIDIRNYPLYLSNGLVFFVSHIVDAWGIKEVFVDKDYQLSQLNKKKFIVIDIGANIGAFSLLATKLGKGVRVFSYEPSLSTFKVLQKNVTVNRLEKQILTFRMAVYNQAKVLRLFNAGIPGARSLFRAHNEKQFEQVKTITISEILKRNKIPSCDFLKVDCEGAEYAIFSKCSPEIFKRLKRISIEFHEMLPDQDHHQLVSLLMKHGFKVKHKYSSIENNIGYIYAYR